jgi:hypothetical protein
MVTLFMSLLCSEPFRTGFNDLFAISPQRGARTHNFIKFHVTVNATGTAMVDYPRLNKLNALGTSITRRTHHVLIDRSGNPYPDSPG